MTKILLIVEKSFDPPSDGVSAAIYSFYLHLNEIGKVDVVFQYNLKLTEQEGEDVTNKMKSSAYDIIVCSPLLPALWLVKNKNFFLNGARNVKKIALLNDCYTYVLYRQIFLSLKFRKGYTKIPVYLLKLLYYYFVEWRVGRFFDFILLQTNKDLTVFEKLFFVKNAFTMPNIPRTPTLTKSEQLHVSRNLYAVGFVATFVGSYCMIAEWFINEIWSEVIKREPRATLHLLGKNNENFIQQFNKDIVSTLVIEKHVPTMGEFYDKVSIAVSPIFKGYGLINKTVDAMSGGCIVIGDTAAFNGLSVTDGEDCIIANNRKEFIATLSENLGVDNSKMRDNAKKAISESLNEAYYTEKLKEIIVNNPIKN